jgi:hypothetical protein
LFFNYNASILHQEQPEGGLAGLQPTPPYQQTRATGRAAKFDFPGSYFGKAHLASSTTVVPPIDRLAAILRLCRRPRRRKFRIRAEARRIPRTRPQAGRGSPMRGRPLRSDKSRETVRSRLSMPSREEPAGLSRMGRRAPWLGPRPVIRRSQESRCRSIQLRTRDPRALIQQLLLLFDIARSRIGGHGTPV